MNRYLILSDLHLCDVEDHPDGWKDYKSSRYRFDGELADLVRDAVRGRPEGVPFTLVLNGDVFDFDLVTAVPGNPPWKVSRSERKRGLDPTPEKSAWKMGRILDDHPGFVELLAGLARDGHRVVFVMGNHDRELHFPEVRQVLLDRIRREVESLGDRMDDSRIRFEPWFFLEPGEIYAEHGNQYDYYSSFRNVLCPTVRLDGEVRIALPMGNLSNRYLLSRMGFFNPHASDFILNLFSYLWHWLRFYAFSRRSLVGSWLWGSLVVMGRLLRVRAALRRQAPDCEDLLGREADRKGLPRGVVAALHRLHLPPITGRFFRIVREFWVDRLLISLLMIGGTVTLALVPIPLWIKLMVPLSAFPLAFFLYESLARGEDIFTAERRMPERAREVARVVPVRLVTFGHSHAPLLVPLARGVAYANSGTWAPIPDRWKGNLREGYRNFVLADLGEGEAVVRLDSGMEMRSVEAVGEGGRR
ncbi:metallophosphoesterase [Myxococcota bacterium]|nr:metallophosphoesterase [Myxococcota bacterium]